MPAPKSEKPAAPPPTANVPARRGQQRFSLIEEFAAKNLIDPARVLPLLRSTAFRVKAGEPPATDEELLQLMLVSRVYNLNPFTREIYAFRSKLGGLVPIIGVDGWIRLVEAQPTFVGHEERFGYDETIGPKDEPLGFYAECVIHRKDRQFPVSHRAYYKENVRDTDPWTKMPARMLGHRAYIQAARRAFGFGGIYDEDEGEVIALGGGAELIRPVARPGTGGGGPAVHGEGPPGSVTTEYAGSGGGGGSASITGEARATEDALEHVKELLAKTGVPDSFVLARFEVGTFEELRASQIPDVLKFIQDNAP